jgi:chromosomal replication initiator protein
MVKDHIFIWNNCLNIIKKSIDAQPFKTWFEPIKSVRLTNSVLTIQVPNKFFYEWLEEHYVDVLKKAVKQELGLKGSLEYNILVENHRKISAGNEVSSTLRLNKKNQNL